MKFVPVSKWVSHTFSAISVRVRILSGFWTKKRSKLYSFGVSIMDCPFRETDSPEIYLEICILYALYCGYLAALQ
jgi:hypothetical protein